MYIFLFLYKIFYYKILCKIFIIKILYFSIMGKGDTLDEMAMEKVVDLLENKGFKNKLIKKLNDAVDIPLINEKTEKKVLDSIYKLLLDTIKEL